MIIAIDIILSCIHIVLCYHYFLRGINDLSFYYYYFMPQLINDPSYQLLLLLMRNTTVRKSHAKLQNGLVIKTD